MARRLNLTLRDSLHLNDRPAAPLIEQMASLHIKDLLCLSGAVDVVKSVTDRLATYPPTTPDPLHVLIQTWRQQADVLDSKDFVGDKVATIVQLRECANALASIVGEPEDDLYHEEIPEPH